MAHKQLIIRNGESSLVTRRFIGAVKQCSVANTQTLSFQTLQNVTGGTRSCNKRSLNTINRVEGSTCIPLTRINFTTLRWLTSIRFVLNNKRGRGGGGGALAWMQVQFYARAQNENARGPRHVSTPSQRTSRNGGDPFSPHSHCCVSPIRYLKGRRPPSCRCSAGTRTHSATGARVKAWPRCCFALRGEVLVPGECGSWTLVDNKTSATAAANTLKKWNHSVYTVNNFNHAQLHMEFCCYISNSCK